MDEEKELAGEVSEDSVEVATNAVDSAENILSMRN